MFSLNINIFSLNDKILNKTKIFFWLNKNMSSFLDKQNIEYKIVFLQHFSNHREGDISFFPLWDFYLSELTFLFIY